MLKALHLPGGGGGGGLVVYQLSGEAAEGGGGDGGGKRRRKVALLFVTADKTVAQRALARAAPPACPDHMRASWRIEKDGCCQVLFVRANHYNNVKACRLRDRG